MLPEKTHFNCHLRRSRARNFRSQSNEERGILRHIPCAAAARINTFTNAKSPDSKWLPEALDQQGTLEPAIADGA